MNAQHSMHSNMHNQMQQNLMNQMGDHGRNNVDYDDENSGYLGGPLDPKRTYRKKKTWCMSLKIVIETPALDHRLNESFEIEIGSNQRLKILHQTILSYVKNPELRELIKKEKMYIYIEGKEPVARKSKSLAEMGVKDGETLIVTTEMKLPFDDQSEDEDLDGNGALFPGADDFDNDDNPVNNLNMHRNTLDRPQHVNMPSPRGYEIPPPHLQQNQKDLNVSPKNKIEPSLGIMSNLANTMPPQTLPSLSGNMDLLNKSNTGLNLDKNKPPMGVHGQMQQRPQPLQKAKSEKIGRKPNPTDKKAVQPKSPAVKKAREVAYAKLFIVQ